MTLTTWRVGVLFEILVDYTDNALMEFFSCCQSGATSHRDKRRTQPYSAEYGKYIQNVGMFLPRDKKWTLSSLER
jgi:hypothetical protein